MTEPNPPDAAPASAPTPVASRVVRPTGRAARRRSPASRRTPRYAWPVLAAVVIVCAAVIATTVTGPSHPLVGRALPAIAGIDLDGRAASLPAGAGRPVVVAVWANWCPHCAREMPLVGRALAARAGRLGVVSVSTNPDAAPAAQRAVATRWGLPGVTIADADSAIARRLGVVGYPTLVLVGSDGTVHDVVVGEVPAADLAARLDALR